MLRFVLPTSIGGSYFPYKYMICLWSFPTNPSSSLNSSSKFEPDSYLEALPSWPCQLPCYWHVWKILQEDLGLIWLLSGFTSIIIIGNNHKLFLSRRIILHNFIDKVLEISYVLIENHVDNKSRNLLISRVANKLFPTNNSI